MVVHRSASRDDGREKRRLVPRCDLADDLRLTIVGPLSGVVMTGCLSSCGLLIGRRYPSAFCFSWSNSVWLIVPLSSSC